MSASEVSHEQFKLQIDELNVKIIDQISENFIHTQTIAQLRVANENLSSELDELKKMHIFKTNQLKAEINCKNSEQNDKVKEDDFNPKHKTLIEVQDGKQAPHNKHCTPKTKSKSRRQSIQDERRLSLWEMNRTVATMTENLNGMCGCNEKNDKIVEITRQMKLKDCRIRQLEMMAENSPLQIDVNELKKVCV